MIQQQNYPEVLKPQFRRYRHIFLGFQQMRPAARLIGPPVACIGWIPHYATRKDIPESGIRSYDLATRKWWHYESAVELMFWSGNPPPPSSFASRNEFLTMLTSREFRGALAIDNVSALMAPGGYLMGIEFDYLIATGTTFVRSRPRSKVRLPCPGIGEGDHAVSAIPNKSIVVETWVHFKMGKFVDIANYLLTGVRATSATLKLDYSIRTDHTVEISLSGSFVPTQSHFVRWADRCEYYDMMSASQSEIAGFFGAGACVTAPVEERTRIADSARHRWE